MTPLICIYNICNGETFSILREPGLPCNPTFIAVVYSALYESSQLCPIFCQLLNLSVKYQYIAWSTCNCNENMWTRLCQEANKCSLTSLILLGWVVKTSTRSLWMAINSVVPGGIPVHTEYQCIFSLWYEFFNIPPYRCIWLHNVQNAAPWDTISELLNRHDATARRSGGKQ